MFKLATLVTLPDKYGLQLEWIYIIESAQSGPVWLLKCRSMRYVMPEVQVFTSWVALLASMGFLPLEVIFMSGLCESRKLMFHFKNDQVKLFFTTLGTQWATRIATQYRTVHSEVGGVTDHLL